jgi:hypothetical protein
MNLKLKKKNTKRKNTKRKYNKKGGAAAEVEEEPTNAISRSIIKFKHMWECSREGECQHTMYGLYPILDDAGYTIPIIVQQQPLINFESIRPFFLANTHFLLQLSAPGHYYFMEMHNGNIRIFSLWGSRHGLYDYYKKNIPYGKMRPLTGEFIESFNRLYSQNDTEINRGILEIFGENVLGSYKNTSFYYTLYAIIPKSIATTQSSNGYNSDKTAPYNGSNDETM